MRDRFARVGGDFSSRYSFEDMILMDIQENVNLAEFTTLGVGGPAKYFVYATSEREVAEAYDWAMSAGENVFILGGGSNVLVSDAGFHGLVIKIEIGGIEFRDDGDETIVTAGAGEHWDSLVDKCVGRGLAGFECMSGIPGTVGGTPVQNVGAYGQEVAETIVSVRCFDRDSGEVTELSNAECMFAYRRSIFNTSQRDRYIVLSVTYRLRRDGHPEISYKDLRDHFEGGEPGLVETREAVLRIRRSKSMVVDANDPNSRSVGSFFKNPIVGSAFADMIAKKPGGDRIPRFPAGDGLVKISAAWLIERSGIHKGFSLGNAGISENHALAIVNRGGATAAEIVSLKKYIQNLVFEKFEIELQPEPILIGF